MALPGALSAALELLLYDADPKELARLSRALSDGYRSGMATASAGAISDAQALAYAAVRLPATYGAVEKALDHLHHAVPNLIPATMLDIGAGPGTALWAAPIEFPTLTHLTAVEPQPQMRRLAHTLLQHTRDPVLRETVWQHGDIALQPLSSHDLVVASYVLGELPPEQWQDTLLKVWAATRAALVIIEPGTPAGFARIRRFRNFLIERGAFAAAPCPHEGACPMAGEDWCHFSVRIPRSRRQRQMKGATLPYEDEKFSYVALVRTVPTSRFPRVLRHPEIQPGRIGLRLCGPDGRQDVVVTRQSPQLFRQARKVHWGDRWQGSSE